MLNAKTIIELGDREDDAPGYSDGAALVAVVDEIRFAGSDPIATRTNVITVNLDAFDEADFGEPLTLADAQNLRAALDHAIAYVEEHGQTLTVEDGGDEPVEAAHG